MAALAAVVTVLHKYSGETDISVGTQLAGREEVELEPIVGYFANTIVLQADLGGDPSFAELLGRVRDLVLDAFDNQHLPYESLIASFRDRPQIGRTPIYSVNFVLQRDFVSELTLGDGKLVSLPSAPAGALYDLSFFMVERAEGWRLSCEYKTDLFEETTAVHLLAQIIRVMETAAETPRLAISEYATGSAPRTLFSCTAWQVHAVRQHEPFPAIYRERALCGRDMGQPWCEPGIAAG